MLTPLTPAPYLIPARDRTTWKAAFAEQGDIDADSLMQNTYSDIADRLEYQISKLGLGSLTQARLTWWMIHRLGSVLGGDGATNGLMHNNPDLINPGLAVLSPAVMPGALKLLTYAKSILPPHLDPTKDIEQVQQWVLDELTKEQSDKLEQLGDAAEPYHDGAFKLCNGIVAEHMDDFFAQS